MKSIAKRFWAAVGHFEAWFLIFLGLAMFSVRTPLPEFEYLHLPFTATVIQTAGLMFAIFGFQIMASIFMWPHVSFARLVELVVMERNTAAGLVAAGLLTFNGLCMLAFTIWLSGSLTMGAGAR